jgi:hypothetical protein
MNKKLATIVAMSAAALLLAAGSASAVTMRAGGQGLVGTYCQKEIVRYCPRIGHGSGAVPRCLMQHDRLLSRSCRRALDLKGPGGGIGQGMAPRGRMRSW